MRIMILREETLDAFNVLSAIVKKESPLAAIQNVRLDASVYDAVSYAALKATNLEMSLSRRLDGVDVDDGGEVLLSPRFHQILRNCSDETLSLTTEGTNLIVKGARSRHVMPLEDASTFPESPAFEATEFYRLGAGELKRAIKHAVHVCADSSPSGDSMNRTFDGLQFIVSEGSMMIGAFDGHRCAFSDVAAATEGSPGYKITPVVPKAAVKVLESILDDDGPAVDFAWDRNSAFFRCDGSFIWTRLMEGKPAPIQMIADLKFPDQAEITVRVLKEAIASASVMTSKESCGVSFVVDGGEVRVSAKTADIGNSEAAADISWKGERREFMLQSRYALGALTGLDLDEKVSVGVVDWDKPVLFGRGKFMHIVMPIMIQPEKGA